MIKRSECRCSCHNEFGLTMMHIVPCCEPDDSIVGIDEALNETHAQIKTAVAKRNEEEHRRIWNAAIEAAASKLDELSADKYRANEIRKLKK